MGNVHKDIEDGEPGPWICFAIIIVANILVYLINENNIFRKQCHCQTCPNLLGVTNRAADVPLHCHPHTFLAWELLDGRHQGRGRRIPPWAILLYRLLCLAVYLFTVLWQRFGVRKLAWPLKPDELTYFTNWTFVGFGLSSLLGVVVSFKQAFITRESRPKLPEPAPPAGVMRYTFLEKAYHFVFMAVATASPALSIFYWTMLYDVSAVRLDSLFKHGVSTGLLLLDVLISRIPIVTYHVAIPVWYTTAYAVFFWIYYDRTGHWVYGALDWRALYKAVYYFAIVLLLFIMAALLYALAGLRELFITGKCCCMCGCCACCGDCCQPVQGEAMEQGSTELVHRPTAPTSQVAAAVQLMTA